MTTTTETNRPLRRALCLAALFALTACGGNGSDSDTTNGNDTNGEDEAPPAAAPSAIVRTVASDFASGDVEVVRLDQEPLAASGGLFSGKISDLAISTFGDSYFLIERSQADRISRIDLESPGDVVWEYATIDQADDASANPAELVTLRADKAYLLRYNSARAWIVDPSADDEDDFKLGELDLSAYIPPANEERAVPAMIDGAIVDDEFFIVMQRLDDSFQPVNDAYVAVFDTANDEEIETSQGSDGLSGIRLDTRNPNGLEHHPDAGLFVHSVGDRNPEERIGGIERIDPDSFEPSTVLAERNVDGLALLDDGETGYFLEYEAFGENVLHHLDLATGAASDPIAGFANRDLREVATAPDGRLWITDADTGNPRIRILDPATDETNAADDITTDLLPASIDFAALDGDDAGDNGDDDDDQPFLD